jgi:hypothetical protein
VEQEISNKKMNKLWFLLRREKTQELKNDGNQSDDHNRPSSYSPERFIYLENPVDEVDLKRLVSHSDQNNNHKPQQRAHISKVSPAPTDMQFDTALSIFARRQEAQQNTSGRQKNTQALS